MLRKIRLYGALAKFVGHRVLEADVASAAEAVRFLVANWPSLECHMATQQYRVRTAGDDLGEDELHSPMGTELRIIPVIGGAGSVGRILLGTVLLAVSAVPGFQAFAGATVYSMITGLGTSLVLGGIAGLLTPAPSTKGGDNDPRRSFSFSGIQNTSRAGLPVPVVYGEILVGSVVVSAGIDTVQVAV